MMKYILYLVLACIIVPIIVNGLMFVPSPWAIRGGFSDWIGFFGSFTGGIIGAFIALLIAKNEIRLQKENEEENRKISQIKGLVRVKYELKKIIKNFNILEGIRNELKATDMKVNFEMYKHELEELNNSYWESLNTDDIELELDLLELKDFYDKFREVLLLDVTEASFKIKEMNIKKEEMKLKSYETIDSILKEAEINNRIIDIESEIDDMKNKKGTQWDVYNIKNYNKKCRELLETIERKIRDIQKILQNRKKIQR